MLRDPGTSLKERNASQILTAPVHHCSSSSHYLIATVLEISHQDCRAESFLNSWFTETRKDNKMIVDLSQFFFLGGDDLFCSNSDWNTGTLVNDEAPEWRRDVEGQEMGERGSYLCLSCYSQYIFKAFCFHIWLPEILPLYFLLWLPSMRKALPCTRWVPFL